MSVRRSILFALFSLSMFASPCLSQEPKGKDKGPKSSPDETRAIYKSLEKAYKPAADVNEKILKEIRKSYQSQSADQEAKIFKEMRRLYQVTSEGEEAILREIRKAYDSPSAAQEERIIEEILKLRQLEPGEISPELLAERAEKSFRKLDRDGNGTLDNHEMSDTLRSERERWDGNRDGTIDIDEYRAYYRAQTQKVAERALGQSGDSIPGPGDDEPNEKEEPRPVVFRAGKLPPGLPDWFAQLDTDKDAQIGLYEWKVSGRSFEEFRKYDRNDDGFITIDELQHYLADESRANSAATAQTNRNGMEYGPSNSAIGSGNSGNGVGVSYQGKGKGKGR